MQIYHKLYLTGMLVLDMAMTNYCYNAYGLSPDFNFFHAERAEYAQSVASSNKARFISNYTPVYDNIISGMAFMDESVSTGALYIDYRKKLCSRIFLDGINIKVPDMTEKLDKRFTLKINADYAGDSEAAEIYAGKRPVAAVRIKNGLFYRLSSSDECFMIDDVGVGMNISEVVRKWGPPSGGNHPIYIYSAGSRASVTLITTPDGFITWMLYESLGRTEDKPDSTETAAEETTVTAAEVRGKKRESAETRDYPVADSVLKYNHKQKDKKQEKNK